MAGLTIAPVVTNATKRELVMSVLSNEEFSGWSDRAIAKHCGVAHSFVNKMRSLFFENSDNQQTRTYVTKHGTIAQMKVSKIGKKSAANTILLPRQKGAEYSQTFPSSAKLKEAKKVRTNILLLICRKPGLTAEEISNCVGRSPDQVRRHAKTLISEGLIHSREQDRKRYYPGISY